MIKHDFMIFLSRVVLKDKLGNAIGIMEKCNPKYSDRVIFGII